MAIQMLNSFREQSGMMKIKHPYMIESDGWRGAF